jgi:hypothetical protein
MRHQSFLLPKPSPTRLRILRVEQNTAEGRRRSRRRRWNPASPRLGRIRFAGSYRTARRLFRALEDDDWWNPPSTPPGSGSGKGKGKKEGWRWRVHVISFGAFLSRAPCVRVRVCWSGRQTGWERTRGVYSEVALFRLSLFGSRCEWMNLVSVPSWWMSAVVLA